MNRTVFVNPDLVRSILLAIESASFPLKGRIGSVVVENHDLFGQPSGPELT